MRLPFSRAASGGNFLGPACEPQDIRRDQVDDGAVDGRFLRVFELSDEAVDGPAEDDVPPLSLADCGDLDAGRQDAALAGGGLAAVL